MKPVVPVGLATAITALVVAANAFAEKLPEGQVDFGVFSPPGSGGEFVEVNLTSSLISLAAKFVEKQDAEIANVIKGVHLVRVNVVGLDDQNRSGIEERVQKVRKQLEGNGWEKIVTARQKDQDVGVYLKTRDQDTVQGLVVVVLDSNKQAVFVNVVGNIKPEQLSMLGEKLHIEPLKEIGAATGK
jgi:hypothetical protein